MPDKVEIGQSWLDNDNRHLQNVADGKVKQREILVLEIKGGKAYCKNPETGRSTWISLARFKPTSTGYRFKG